MDVLPGARGGSIVGAPVCTRTAASSLRVSFLPPGCRVCSFDCVYCPYAEGERAGGWPTPGAIGSAVAQALGTPCAIDSVTISGTGEPTLHPRFGLAVANVLTARQLRPRLPVRIATNGTTAMHPTVRRVLDLLDERIVRLDARGEEIDVPSPRRPLGSIVAALGRLRDFSVESVFVDGHVSNTDPGSVLEWIGLLAELRPSRVYVTTTRKPSSAGVRPTTRGTLEHIARGLHRHSGLRATVIAAKEATR